MSNELLEPIITWFSSKNWTPYPFQKEAWNASLEGKSGLISVPTGSGKTYAAFLGPMASIAKNNRKKGLKILYISPLRALTRDIEYAIKLAIDEMGMNLTVESRTGDTTATAKRKQKKLSPDILLTTPESLSILLSDPEHKSFFSQLQFIIIDEWHELLSSKRGVLLELSLSHLRYLLPDLKIWALSATIKNLEEAAKVAIGNDKPPYLISYELDRPVIIESLQPIDLKDLPWAGFLGLTLLPQVLQILDEMQTTMIFVNTRSQVERWYHANGKIKLLFIMVP
jgi:ATP-dependent helicase Lhr and Lhr-like helicase